MDIETRFEIVGTVNGTTDKVTFFENSRANAMKRATDGGLYDVMIAVRSYVYGECVDNGEPRAVVLCGIREYDFRAILRGEDGNVIDDFDSLSTALSVADGWCRCE